MRCWPRGCAYRDWHFRRDIYGIYAPRLEKYLFVINLLAIDARNRRRLYRIEPFVSACDPKHQVIAIFRSDDLTIDLIRRRVMLDGIDIKLSRTEFAVLQLLASHAGKVLTYDQILREIWGNGKEVEHLRVYIRLLRQKLEKDPHNPRYLVTNLKGEPQPLYAERYCPRGEVEPRIKEQPLDLFSDRTSGHAWWPHPFRLLLASFAYVLLEALRRLGRAGTELARAQAGTLRLKLLKVGAVVVRNRRRVRLGLSSAFPLQEVFCHSVACFYG